MYVYVSLAGYTYFFQQNPWQGVPLRAFMQKKKKQIIMIVEYTINLTKSWTDLKYASHKLRYTWKKHAEFYASLIKCFRHTWLCNQRNA